MPPSVSISVAIPNYNYGAYLEETLSAVLGQGPSLCDVHVSDNASTDRSPELLASIGDPRLSYSQNRTNVGFAGNLDRAVRGTSGEHIALLSSDDLVLPGALDLYAAVLGSLGDARTSTVICSRLQVVDAASEPVGQVVPLEGVWRAAPLVAGLSDVTGLPVRSLPGHALLRGSLRKMRNPLPFTSTVFPRALYDQVEGYGGSKYINPDKWFHLRLVTAASRVIFIEEPLFGYRVHNQNQASQQANEGALKYLLDEYSYTFDAPQTMLDAADMTREELIDAFLRFDIAERAAVELALGDRRQARRALDFALAVYPSRTRRNPLLVTLRVLSGLGVVGTVAARTALQRYQRTDPDRRSWWQSSMRRGFTSVTLSPAHDHLPESGRR